MEAVGLFGDILSQRLRRDVAAELRAVEMGFRPGRDNWKLASYEVAGFPQENKIRPERTVENGRYSVVAPRRKYTSNPKPATA
jgi:hypothetical protein